MGGTGTLRQRGWIPFVALALALLLARLPGADRLEHVVDDFQQGIVARHVWFRDAVVIDIDESSLRGLKPYLGDWPYDRDIYALMLDYLDEHGAKAVVFDILLTDDRRGDDALARSLRRHGNGILAATTATADTRMTPEEVALLAGLRWRSAAWRPGYSWPSLLLPNATLLKGAPSVTVGVAAAVVDSDGVLRRMPLMHETHGDTLPALAVAAMDPEAMKWPVDAEGFVHLYFPANANSVLTLPFQDVAEAALGLTRLREAPEFFRGKTVFVGSTAYLSDRVTTPRGRMSGTYALAVAHQTLQQGLAWSPPDPKWDGLLVAVSVAALAGLLLANLSWHLIALGVAAAVAAVWALHLALLFFGMQQAALLPPLLVLAMGWTFHSLQEQARLRQRETQLEQEADLDSLTGLPVRRALMRMFSRDIAAAKLHARPFAAAILDLDHFKQVNDTYGHHAGDLVLKTSAEVMQRCLRASDSVGRWGGEEFVVLLPDTDLAGAWVVLEKIRRAMRNEAFPVDGCTLAVTISAGIAEYPGGDVSPDDILGAADRALYRAKATGRDRVCVAA